MRSVFTCLRAGLVAVCLAGLAMASPAMATDAIPTTATPVLAAATAAVQAASTTADLTATFMAILSSVAAAIVAIAGFGLKMASPWLKSHGITVDDTTRDYVLNALTNGLAYAKELALREGYNLSHPQVRSGAVAVALKFVNAAVPDGLTRLGLDDQHIGNMLTARLESAFGTVVPTAALTTGTVPVPVPADPPPPAPVAVAPLVAAVKTAATGPFAAALAGA